MPWFAISVFLCFLSALPASSLNLFCLFLRLLCVHVSWWPWGPSSSFWASFRLPISVQLSRLSYLSRLPCLSLHLSLPLYHSLPISVTRSSLSLPSSSPCLCHSEPLHPRLCFSFHLSPYSRPCLSPTISLWLCSSLLPSPPFSLGSCSDPVSAGLLPIPALSLSFPDLCIFSVPITHLHFPCLCVSPFASLSLSLSLPLPVCLSVAPCLYIATFPSPPYL